MTNGIWLCHACSDRVDKDEVRYPVSLLLKWRSDHDEWVSGLNLVPAPPEIILTTLPSLLIDAPGTVDAGAVNTFRDHILEVRTGSRHEVEQLVCRIQFPESGVFAKVDCPPGIGVDFGAERPMMMAAVTGSGRVEQQGDGGASNVFRLAIERLRPARPVKIAVRTIRGLADGAMRSAKEKIGGPQSLFAYVEAHFLYEDCGHFYERNAIYPIETIGDRVYAMAPAEEPGQRELFRASVFGGPMTLSTGTEPFSSASVQGVTLPQK